MRPTVAIVDSDATMRQTLRTLLGTLDVEVCAYDSAESYFARAAAAHESAHEPVPACLIVDVSLSGISGLQMLKQIRATDRKLPVVLLASEAEVAMAVEAMRHGATDFIEKPQLDVALLRRVSQLLRYGVQSGTRDARHVTR